MARLVLVAALLTSGVSSCARIPVEEDNIRAPRWSDAVVTGGSVRGGGSE